MHSDFHPAYRRSVRRQEAERARIARYYATPAPKPSPAPAPAAPEPLPKFPRPLAA